MPLILQSSSRLAAGFCFVWGLAGGATSYADDVRTDDLIVTGGACIGNDCVDGENVSSSSVRLKENNTRVRFYNTSAADILGKSWSLEANDSSNGGPSAFRFKAQSLTQDSIKLSDGTDVGYDCAVGDTFVTPDEALPTLIAVPLGDPIIQNLLTNQFIENSTIKSEYTCSNTDWWTEELLLRLDNAGEDIVTLGRGSAPVPGAISVGNASGLRAVKNVALPTSGTDMLSVDALSLLPDRKARIHDLRASISALESQLTALENADADNDSVPNGTDAFPTDPTESVDSDGDGIGDNADAFDNAITNAVDQGATLSTAPQSPTSTCSVAAFSVSGVDNQEAPGPSIAQQADFVLSGCAPGESVTVTIDFGEDFPLRAAAFKITGTSWALIAGATVSGQAVTYTIHDNGPLDLNPMEGVIEDPVSVASVPVLPVPLPLWLLVILTGCIGWLGFRSSRAFEPAP